MQPTRYGDTFGALSTSEDFKSINALLILSNATHLTAREGARFEYQSQRTWAAIVSIDWHAFIEMYVFLFSTRKCSR